MLIHSKLHRNGGTRVELGKGKDARRYHFRPLDKDASLEDPDQEHVADVTDPKDVATLLAIPEGYEVHASELKKPAAKAAVEVADKANAEAVAKTAAETATRNAAAVAATGPARAIAEAAARAAEPKNYAAIKGKPDLIKLIVQHPKFKGKTPHGTTPREKLIAQLEKLDATA